MIFLKEKKFVSSNFLNDFNSEKVGEK